MTTTADRFCPPWCDGGPDGGFWCGGGDKHVGGWPDGVPFEYEPVTGEDGSTIAVAATRNGVRIDVSVIVRPHGRPTVVVPLSEREAERLGDAAETVSVWSHRGGEI